MRGIGQAVAAAATGRPQASIAAVLQAAQAAARQRRWPPRQVTLRLSEELVYLDVAPAHQPQARHEERLRAELAASLGPEPLTLSSLLLPGARHWLVAAVETSALQGWKALLAQHGAKSVRTELALPHDLAALGAAGRPREGVVALLRSEGATMMRWQHGRLVTLGWERLDPRHGAGVLARIRAFALRHQAAAAPVLLCAAASGNHAELAQLAHREGWRWQCSGAIPAAEALS